MAKQRGQLFLQCFTLVLKQLKKVKEREVDRGATLFGQHFNKLDSMLPQRCFHDLN